MSDRLTRDEYYVAMLRLVAARSTCARRAVGAIITDEQGRVISTGYNGTPVGVTHCTDIPCHGANDPSGDSRRCLAVHAEVNAAIQGGDRLQHAHTIYVSCTPCFSCAKMLINVGVKRVVCLEKYADELGERVLTTAGVQIFLAP